MNSSASSLGFFSVTEEMLHSLMAEAMSRGGDYADIFFEYSTLEEMTLHDHKVTSGGSHVDYGAGVRVIKDSHTGYAFCETTALPSMMRAARSAAAIADSAPTPINNLNVTLVKGGCYYPTTYDWNEISFEKKRDFLLDLDARCCEADERVVSVMARITHSFDRSLFFNSEGDLACDSGPMTSVTLSVVMQDAGSIENNTASRSFRMGAEMLSEQLATELVEEAVGKCSRMFSSKKIKGGEMPVVMAAGGSGILLHEAIGHAFEADFNMKNTSIFSDSLGKKVCRSGINVVDDGTIMYNRGSVNIDDEGVPGQKTYMVRDGVLASYLHDRVTARHYGVSPTGNGRRESFRNYPIPRMRATYMENGACTAASIIEDVKRGIYVDSFSNGQVQIGVGDFTFYVKTGYLIENGRLTTPIKDVNVMGNGPQALADIVAVADDCRIDNGTWTCGKGQNCPVSCGMPTALVSRLTVGGLQ